MQTIGLTRRAKLRGNLFRKGYVRLWRTHNNREPHSEQLPAAQRKQSVIVFPYPSRAHIHASLTRQPGAQQPKGTHAQSHSSTAHPSDTSPLRTHERRTSYRMPTTVRMMPSVACKPWLRATVALRGGAWCGLPLSYARTRGEPEAMDARTAGAWAHEHRNAGAGVPMGGLPKYRVVVRALTFLIVS